MDYVGSKTNMNVFNFSVEYFGLIFSLIAIVFVLGSGIAGKISKPKSNPKYYLYSLALASVSGFLSFLNMIVANVLFRPPRVKIVISLEKEITSRTGLFQ